MQIIEAQTPQQNSDLQNLMNEQFVELGKLHGIDMEMDQIEQRLNHLKGFRALKISEIAQRGGAISQLQQAEAKAKEDAAAPANGKQHN